MNANTALAIRDQRRPKQRLHTRAVFKSGRHGDLRCQAAQRSNPLVKLTRYGSRRLAAPGHGANCPYAAKRRLPQRAAYRER